MSKIDKLIIKAKELKEAKKGFLTFGMINRKGKKWTLQCSIWDGIPGSGTMIIKSEHDTLSEAEQEANRIAEEYPNQFNDVTIIIDDIPGGKA
ncbi:hypothetical protein H0486_18140 [Lachnospiraceae bacterium MD1]|uniref:Uncharacterized protein n=1 Tax=Variimorphobacter saccharofermentans TaxID=2755051 RepID=A0A839K6R3_9FIRM|nr:hypothetical protein [Variimorphobacter saccharofermentans]MBB2184779.1 hypothetical protein [Variimorphobacter saccharofermentans]